MTDNVCRYRYDNFKNKAYCSSYTDYTPHTVSSVDECKRLCDIDENCDTFAYSKSEKKCNTYTGCVLNNEEQSWGYDFQKKNVDNTLNDFLSLNTFSNHGNKKCLGYSDYHVDDVDDLNHCKLLCINGDENLENCNAIAYGEFGNGSIKKCVRYTGCNIDENFTQQWGYDFYKKDSEAIICHEKQTFRYVNHGNKRCKTSTNNKLINNVVSESQCKNKCNNETDFDCNAIAYYSNNNNCTLFENCKIDKDYSQNWGADYHSKDKCYVKINPHSGLYLSKGNKRCVGYSNFNLHYTNNLDECKQKCNNEDNCNAIGYEESTKKCNTYENCTIDENFSQDWGMNFYKN